MVLQAVVLSFIPRTRNTETNPHAIFKSVNDNQLFSVIFFDWSLCQLTHPPNKHFSATVLDSGAVEKLDHAGLKQVFLTPDQISQAGHCSQLRRVVLASAYSTASAREGRLFLPLLSAQGPHRPP